MKFVIITHVEHIRQEDKYYGYAPYVREMRIWLRYVDEVIIVAPLVDKAVNPIFVEYECDNLEFISVKSFSFISLREILRSLINLPLIGYSIFNSIKQADHIHLRCPGNMGLLGCLIQIFFPNKVKTAKYAGNWDSKSKQPWSYRIQKWILSNTFLTKNMQVLVYGEWENQTKNIKPFFTATYSEKEKVNVDSRVLNDTIFFLFVGTLTIGKQPIYALKVVHELIKKGHNVFLDFYGEGNQREILESYINGNNLQEFVTLHGNQSKEIVEMAYKKSHFLILPSKSEGWPKVVAEAMFWGCLPIVTNVSCVSYMLKNGDRGVLLEEILESDILKLEEILNESCLYEEKVENAIAWSREFTVDRFENEIKNVLQ